ncbi:YggS family pyridoxal phosphate-dependent enzyme [Actinotalea sp. M2MS4P-6]|uniref:YggS family pyridoxal phosphate-dependent enzyme n=1 Tax=Actinotalea sp. M2MS4P-6 TaxID=2983762 RepID=UPI0021E48B54|nr:YggS family pyridoxal phosphate-dependent enzyme [Actinotalea sp. M2MS4P-6]MCV2394024.1 YggS family pyridoxal phosphate-dependent enzyme [Actinotalea sp. M2MS4P-6]
MSSPHPDEERAARVAGRWRDAQRRVADAATAAGRDPREVRILLAVKTLPARVVREAVLSGATLLGQNRVQELTAVAPELAALAPTWHVIGHLQSNKVNAALQWAHAVQSVDSTDLAARLSRRCTALDRDLEVWVQVNVSGEATKSGVTPAAALELAAEVAALPRLRLAGLMTIGARSDDEALVRAGYARLRELRDALVGSGAPGTADAHGLSMGMSGDVELAVAEGATMVRLGSAVFGPRPPA